MCAKFVKTVWFMSFMLCVHGVVCCTFALDNRVVKVDTSYEYFYSEDIQNVFKHYLSFMGEDIVFNEVPQGLVISINSRVFFEGDSVELNDYSKPILDMIGLILTYFGQPCVIEGNTLLDDLSGNIYISGVEISTARADKIVEYLIKFAEIAPDKIRSIGFGGMNPSISYKDRENKSIQRIDFVVLNYENFKQ